MSSDNRTIILAATIGYVVFILIVWAGLHQSSQEAAALADPGIVRFFLIFSAFYFLMFAVPLSIKIYSERRSKERSAQLEKQALARGWRYQGDENGVHCFMGTTSNVPWHIEVACHRAGSTFTGYTHWRTDTIKLPGEIVLLVSKAGKTGGLFAPYSRQPDNRLLLDIAMNELIASYQVTSIMLLDDPEDDKEYKRVERAFDKIQQVHVGSTTLRERYLVIAHNETTARLFLDEDLERTLMELVSKKQSNTQKLEVMAVVYWHKGIQFLVNGQIDDFDRLEQFVKLGVTLVSGQKSSVWS